MLDLFDDVLLAIGLLSQAVPDEPTHRRLADAVAGLERLVRFVGLALDDVQARS